MNSINTADQSNKYIKSLSDSIVKNMYTKLKSGKKKKSNGEKGSLEVA